MSFSLRFCCFVSCAFYLLLSQSYPLKGSWGCLMSPPRLESQGCHLISLYYLLSFLLPSPATLFIWSFFCLLVHSSELFPDNPSIFFIKRQAFLYGSCLAARRSWSVVCAACCHMALVFAVMHLCNILIFLNCFCPFLLYIKKKNLVFINRWNGYQRVLPSLMCFLTGAILKETNSSKILFLMFVYFLFMWVWVRMDCVVFG